MKTDKSLNQDREKAIAEISTGVWAGIDSIRAAGRKLVQWIDSDPGFMDYFHKNHPKFSWDTLALLERVGRKQLHEQLVLDTSWGAKKAAGLPYSTQVSLLDKGVEVVHRRDNQIKIEVKALAALTYAETQVVFEGSHILTVEEQTKRLERQSVKTRPARAAYEIGEDGVTVPYRFLTWGQILELAKHAPKGGSQASLGGPK